MVDQVHSDLFFVVDDVLRKRDLAHDVILFFAIRLDLHDVILFFAINVFRYHSVDRVASGLHRAFDCFIINDEFRM